MLVRVFDGTRLRRNKFYLVHMRSLAFLLEKRVNVRQIKRSTLVHRIRRLCCSSHPLVVLVDVYIRSGQCLLPKFMRIVNVSYWVNHQFRFGPLLEKLKLLSIWLYHTFSVPHCRKLMYDVNQLIFEQVTTHSFRYLQMKMEKIKVLVLKNVKKEMNNKYNVPRKVKHKLSPEEGSSNLAGTLIH